MANSKETVRITLEEYKGLLSREIPSDKDKMILDAICEIITDNSEIVDRNTYNSDFKGIHIINANTLVKQILTTVYLLDRGRFIDMYKSLANEKRKDTINEMNMEYVRRIKELKENDAIDLIVENAPTVKAIPIEWINSYTTGLIFSDDYADNAEGIDDYIYCIKEMVRDWEKENGSNS